MLSALHVKYVYKYLGWTNRFYFHSSQTLAHSTLVPTAVVILSVHDSLKLRFIYRRPFYFGLVKRARDNFSFSAAQDVNVAINEKLIRILCFFIMVPTVYSL